MPWRARSSLRQDCRRVRGNFEKELEDAVDGAVADMKRDVPVRSTDLKDSIEAERLDDLELAIVALFYWRFVNFGTRHAAAQPFVDQGLEWARARLRQANLE